MKFSKAIELSTTLEKIGRRVREWDVQIQPEWVDELIERMSLGKTYISFCASKGLSRKAAEDLLKYDQWREAFEIGEARRMAYWEDVLHESAVNGSGSNHSIAFALKNYFPKDFKDKTEVERTNNTIIHIDTGLGDDPKPIDFKNYRVLPSSDEDFL